jgi:hypothetical protein
MGEKRNAYRVLVGYPEAYENLGVDGIIILKRILNKQNGRVWSKFIWLRI